MNAAVSRRTFERGASLGQLACSIADAGAVLVPASAAEPMPEGVRVEGPLATLLTTPYARRLIEHAAMARNAAASVRPLVPTHLGVAVVRLPLSRAHGTRLYVAATIPEETLETNDFTRLAHSALLDAPTVREMIREMSPIRATALVRFERLMLALARNETDRVAGLEAGAQLSTAWEELHLLHSLAEAMGKGISPADFARRTLAETRRTLGCRWTALCVDSALATIIGLKPGQILVDGEDGGLATTVLRESASITAPAIVDPQLVVAPLGQDGTNFGGIAAGGLIGPDGRENASGMSSVERTLVGTAAGNLSVFIDNARLTRDRDQLFLGALTALVGTIDAKDPYTRGHSQRVALLSEQIAIAAGLPDGFVHDIAIAGLVHDVGKIAVPESVLCKQGRLTDEEYAIVKQHPERGYQILRALPDSTTILEGVLHHHERYAGNGYPHGLVGEQIPVAARIIAIADTFDAMSSTRTYRRALTRSDVLAEMRRLAGVQFDPTFLEAFLRVDLSHYDSLVEHDMHVALPGHVAVDAVPSIPRMHAPTEAVAPPATDAGAVAEAAAADDSATPQDQAAPELGDVPIRLHDIETPSLGSLLRRQSRKAA